MQYAPGVGASDGKVSEHDVSLGKVEWLWLAAKRNLGTTHSRFGRNEDVRDGWLSMGGAAWSTSFPLFYTASIYIVVYPLSI